MVENSKKILLVEDDVFVSDIYHRKLTQDGYDVDLANNGLEAIKALEKNIPDLIVLDILMPYMDGREVLEKLKENKKWKDIPVIMLTNLSEKDEMEKDLEAGIGEYLIKSHFTPSEVVEKIEALLK